MDIDDGFAGFEADIGKPRAVRRPRRRNDRLAGPQRGLRVGAVGIRDVQLPGIASGLYDIRDTGGEHAALAGQLLVDTVGDPVGCQPQFCSGRDIRQAIELRLVDGIEQSEPYVVAAVGEAFHTAERERVGAAALPLREVDVGVVCKRLRACIDDAKQPAAREVGAHDRVDVLRWLPLLRKRRDRDRELLRPTPAISTRNCARAANGSMTSAPQTARRAMR